MTTLSDLERLVESFLRDVGGAFASHGIDVMFIVRDQTSGDTCHGATLHPVEALALARGIVARLEKGHGRVLVLSEPPASKERSS